MWTTTDYTIRLEAAPTGPALDAVAERVYALVFRSDFRAPGVALVALGKATSRDLRMFMVALKQALGDRHQRWAGLDLGYLSMGRFDQQATTKFHLDGSPDEAYLMLGYEPSEVRSALAVADYSRAAQDWGITPKQLLTDRNPMYPGHERALLPYVTRLESFDPEAAQMVLINNSSLPFEPAGGHPLGVMHQATIFTPTPGARRVVNSTMIGALLGPSEEEKRAEALATFLTSTEIAGEIAPRN